ncbi:phosphotransferase family protein [Mangrovactinospora gilvigrisea]|nr:aminoglycoside phosphotransferase family protein [Mangrovactinospora gilvigrisea]
MEDAEVAARWGPDAVAAPVQGAANRVWFVGGGQLVLRVARPGCEADLRKEAAVIPAAVAAGVRTPDLVEAGELADGRPFLVVRRAHGAEPALPVRAQGDPAGAVFRSVGRELALVHAKVGPVPGVPGFEEGDGPRADTAALVAAGWIGSGAGGWLDAWFARLEEWAAPTRGPGPVLVHGDASPQNLLADPATGALTALLDWGDAELADPAVDFAKVPLRAVPYVLDGYLGERAGDPELVRSWAARVLGRQLHWALGRLAGGSPVLGASWWSAEPGSRLLEVLRFFADAGPLPPGWAGLTPCTGS